ncbi:DNA mismatch repair endonuclease MutL [Blattabacterium cuenoti]|uniref:DNA mismatch repair endonuclease MutL n=1 Tax=Blattabacterium cuenoti TaxID=1653831 RepID=UPI00163CDE0C|nr:DNA mismatch repair endonuclease MutL [Blattabacterium cuenoti]
MNKNVIKILPKNVINQIAAGEIIERPSSVVRELLENAIDANAKKIDIFIKNSGKTLIQLVDDGDGMSSNDAKMSIQKFATSKINSADDLFKINTKGFRGEALSSIALISELEIQTKNNENSEGIHLFIEEGKIKKEIPINMLRGTRIFVKNIFSRFPVRRKFLKTSQIEFIHILNEFYKIAISHREIAYRFFHNEKILFYFKESSLKKRIKEIFKNENTILTPILIKKNKFFIKGFISFPNSSTKKGDRLLVVNKRCVKHLYLQKEIIHAYNGFIKNFNTISYFIFIEIDPKLVNWNVHPAKKEVKLDKEETISYLIKQEIKNVLFQQYKIENIKDKELKDYDILSSFHSSTTNNKMNLLLEHDNSYFFNSGIHEQIFQLKYLLHQDDKKYYINSYIKLHNYILHKKKIKTIQIYRKYVIFESNNENMIVVDQHRAHKNILYNFFYSKKLIIQKLFFPLKIKLSEKELIYLNNIRECLKKLGFYFYIKNKSVYLYTIPDNIHQNSLKEIFKNVLNFSLKEKNKKNKDILIKSISDSASIKYGEKLNHDQMECLIRDFFYCKNYNYSYTEGPVFFIVNEKIFKKK